MIDLKDLEAFLAIVDGGSLSQAAHDLGLTQPALSLKLKKMEQEFGVKLFQRTPRNMVPLDTAQLIESRVRNLLIHFYAIKESLVTDISKIEGQIRFGCLMGWFQALILPTLGHIHREAPGLRVRLHVDQTAPLLQMLIHGQLDVAIVAHPFEEMEGITTQHLLNEELVLVGHRLPKGQNFEQRRKELLQRPWVTLTVPDPLVDKYWRTETAGEAFPWDKITVPVSLDHIQALPTVLKSIPDAVAILPRQTVAAFHLSGELQISSATKPLQNGLYLAMRSDALSLKRFQCIRDILLLEVQTYLENLT